MDAARATPELSVKTGPSAPLCETAKSGLISLILRAFQGRSVTCHMQASHLLLHWFLLFSPMILPISNCKCGSPFMYNK